MARVARIAIAGALLATLAGGGAAQATKPVVSFSSSPVKARFVARAAPVDRGPPPGASGVALKPSGLGFVAGGREIARTRDFGKTWKPVWTRARARFLWVGFAGSVVFAAADVRGAPILLRSQDEGGRWSTIRPTLPRAGWPWRDLWWSLDFEWVSSRIGFATVDPDNYDFIGRVLRTEDGGRTWRLVGPRRAHAFARVGRSILVLAPGRRPCQRLWRSDDLGSTWHVVPWRLRCGLSLSALSIVSATHGYAAGGTRYYTTNDPRGFLLETRDGGVSWRRIWVSKSRFMGQPFNRLEIDSSGFGVALNGGCKDGQNSPCTGSVFVSRDAGRSWSGDGIDAYRVAFAGRRALAVQDAGEDFVALYERVRTGLWTPRARLSLLVRRAVARGRFDDIQVWTEVGGFHSQDRGASFHVLESYPGPYQTGDETVLNGVRFRTSDRGCTFSRDGGRTWAGTVPIDECWYAKFDLDSEGRGVITRAGLECPEDMGPIFTTEDAGRTWSRSALRMMSSDVAVDGRLIAVTGRARTPAGACARVVALSRDGLRSWTHVDLPGPTSCDSVSIAGETIWLSSCSRGLSGFVSTDAGRHFTAIAGRTLGIVALGGERAVATRDYRGGLWKTSDGGRTWQQWWPRLPIEAINP